MLYILVLIVIGVAGITSLQRPWVGVVVSYLVVVLAPHTIWFWAFGGLRPFLYVAVPALLGTLFGIARGELSAAALKGTIPRLVFIWWICLIVSYYLGDFTHHPGPPRFFQAAVVMEAMNKTMVFFFVAIVCINQPRAFRWLCGVLIVSAAYYTYWANDVYLSGQTFLYMPWGRMGGPFDTAGNGPYTDENNFGMLFVITLPFLVNFAFYLRNIWFRWALLALAGPLGWHAIFLTGSRGAMLGLGVSLAATLYRSSRRAYALLLIPVFVAAFAWQGGFMRDRMETVPNYEEDSSASTRITAWKAASRMFADHPITGVGIASFGPAFPSYSSERPRAAHSTFFQLAAESGLIAGVAWAVLCLGTLLTLVRMPRPGIGTIQNDEERFFVAMREAVIASLAGFFVVAQFLSLQANEVFFCLLIIAHYVRVRSERPVLSRLGGDSRRLYGAPVAGSSPSKERLGNS